MNSTETAAAEARLDLRIATASPGPYFFNPDLAAVALSLARALREELRVRQEDKGEETMQGIDAHHATVAALADWDTMLGEIASGRNA